MGVVGLLLLLWGVRGVVVGGRRLHEGNRSSWEV